MNPDLARVLQTYRKQIVQRWVELIRSIPKSKYSKRPLSELAASTEEGLVAIIEVFERGSRVRLDNYLRNVCMIRFQMGFDIAEVSTALLFFKEAFFPALCEHYKNQPEKLIEIIPQVDRVMRQSVSKFSEIFASAYYRRLQKNLDELHEHENLTHQQNDMLARNYKEITSLVESVRIIASTLDLDTVLHYIIDQASDLMNAHNCILYEFDATEKILILRTKKGELTRGSENDQKVGPEFINRVLATKEAFAVSDTSDPEFQKEMPMGKLLVERNIMAFMATPLLYKNEALGGLAILYERPHDFTDEEKKQLSTFSLHAALAIENARLFKRSRKAAILEERNRLAREMHDNLAQGLTAIVLQLEIIDRLLEKDPTRIKAELEQAKIQARGNLQEARRSVWDLRAGSDEMLSLSESIKKEVEKLRVVSDLQINFDIEGEAVALAWEATSHVFRIFQESMNNILQHAHAKNAWITIDFEEQLFKMQIEDDGIGLHSLETKPVDTKKGFGLTGMQERARLLKGVLNINSTMESGTTVVLEIPIKPWIKTATKLDEN